MITNFISFNLHNLKLDTINIVSIIYRRTSNESMNSTLQSNGELGLESYALDYPVIDLHTDIICLLCFSRVTSTLQSHNFCIIWQTPSVSPSGKEH